MEVTQLLERAANGQSQAANQLMPVIYDRLRLIARKQLNNGYSKPALETRELIHEAYLALFGDAHVSWRDRGHFFSYAAKTMRNILADHARRRLAQKRGGTEAATDLDGIEVGTEAECEDLAALDQALTNLADAHPRLVSVVEMRFFAGFSVEETADALGIDPRSVERDWRKARAFINHSLGRPTD